MQKIETESAAPECPPGHSRAAVVDSEVTPEMIWAGLEEWSCFDEARDELQEFLARMYRAMNTVHRNADALRIPPIAHADGSDKSGRKHRSG